MVRCVPSRCLRAIPEEGDLESGSGGLIDGDLLNRLILLLSGVEVNTIVLQKTD
jgi:hypothetical protein